VGGPHLIVDKENAYRDHDRNPEWNSIAWQWNWQIRVQAKQIQQDYGN
jgi:hypothetical protein